LKGGKALTVVKSGIRATVFKGGIYLLLRQAISVLLKFVGIILITRVLGPERYAPYVAALGIYQYAFVIGDLGVSVYLLRQPGVLSETTIGTAYSLLLLIASGLVGLAELGKDYLEAWTAIPQFASTLEVLVFALVFQLSSIPPLVRLERDLNYQRVALIEFAGQIFYYALAIVLVFLGYGPVALASSFLLQNIVTCILAHVAAQQFPHLKWDRASILSNLRFTSSYSTASWLWQLRRLVNPLIVGHFLGARAVGLVGTTIGIVELLSIVRVIAWRISIPVMARLQHQRDLLLDAVRQGIELQILAAGSALAVFSWVGDFIIERLFGMRWLPMMDIFPYVAVSYLAQAYFSMYVAALSVFGSNGRISMFNFVHIAIFTIAAITLVPTYGITGYGFADCATLVGYILIGWFATEYIGRVDNRLPALWAIAFAVGIFWRQLGLWAIAVPFAALLLPSSLRKIGWYWTSLMQPSKASA
jgi:PST family polysaccharide transporter